MRHLKILRNNTTMKNKNFICFLEKCCENSNISTIPESLKTEDIYEDFVYNIYNHWLNLYKFNNRDFYNRLRDSVSFIESVKNKTKWEFIILYYRKKILSAYERIVK